MARPIVKQIKPTIKWKQGQLAHSANKQVKNWVLDTSDIWTIPSLIA